MAGKEACCLFPLVLIDIVPDLLADARHIIGDYSSCERRNTEHTDAMSLFYELNLAQILQRRNFFRSVRHLIGSGYL